MKIKKNKYNLKKNKVYKKKEWKEKIKRVRELEK